MPSDRNNHDSGDFLSLLVHEMRNFIAPVRNAVYLLRIGGAGEAQVRAAADIIERQATGMSKLLDKLAEADRLRRGDVKLELVPCQLAEIVDTAILAVRPLVESRRQRLHVSLPSIELQLPGDADRLAQAFSLVLERAANHTQEDGDIWLDAAAAGDEVQVRIRDNGPGIATESLASLFDFFSAPIAPGQSGPRELGLELPVARKLIEMHGGRLAAAGAGKGSEFTIDLPATDGVDRQGFAAAAEANDRADAGTGQNAGQTPDDRASPGRGRRRRVLIVDDNAALRETFSDLMQEMGHEVLVAAEGFQALDVARRSTPEFVFLDINMPNLNGYEVARQLRAQFKTGAMRLVMMSGDTLTETMLQRARQAGFDHCIDKIGDLELVRELLSGKA